MQESHDTKTFVKDDELAVIVCPSCTAAKSINVAQYRNGQHTIKVKCRCGSTFKVLLDFRQAYRKPTDLSGTYVMVPPASGGGQMKVRNVSLTGIGFEVMGFHAIQTGEKAIVEFTLDNRKEARIKKKVTVKSVRGAFIGCEFHQDQAFEKDLGFYLRF